MTEDFAPGGYRCIPAVFQYSSGVAAMAGFRLERVRFQHPVPLEDGFRRVEAHLAALGRPTTAFAACELRSPAPFTEQGFVDFNRLYCRTLEGWGIMRGDWNPVARSNVCPELHKPAGPSFHAFTYTVPDGAAAPSFVVAGGAEAREGLGSYAERITAHGDTSRAGMHAKASHTLGEQARRLSKLGFGWGDCTAVQAYTVHDLTGVFMEVIAAQGAALHGLTWHPCRPPVQGLDFEMDCRGLALERVLPVG